MHPRFITKSIHAYLDYPVAVSLMAMPFLLDLGQSNSFAFWLSLVTGVAAFALTLLTDHHLGVIKLLSYRFHLAVDFTVGVVFALAPFALDFSGLDAMYYWANGLAVLFVVGLHKPEENLQFA